MDEAQLIHRVLAGDASAERLLYDTHVDRVYRLAYRMTGDDTLARDFTQEAFVRAFDTLSSFRQQSALSTWLHSVTMSVVLNGLRKVKRHRTRETVLEAAENQPSASSSGDPNLRARLERAIDKLSNLYRAVFVMHDVEGYTHEQISAVLKIPVGTSKARLSRARSSLRKDLEDLTTEWSA